MTRDLPPGRLRLKYWQLSNSMARLANMLKAENRPFGREVLRSHARHLFSNVSPVRDEYEKAARDAAAWILRAQAATPDDGVSHGYFPCHWDHGWRGSYPETTGYIIPSLLEFAKRYDDPQARTSALKMAHWESAVQMANGAVQGGPVCDPADQVPAVFNTGMVLQGWTAAWRETKDDTFFESGRRAADFLVSDLGADGHYRSHGGYVTQHEIKTYNVLCSWALYRFSEDSGDQKYADAAVRNGEAALAEQNSAGWFANSCLTVPEAPLTHTLGYTMQGLLELGVLSGRDDFVAAAEKASRAICRQVAPGGYLAGRFSADWQPRASYSCLTGSVQIAIVLYRLFELTGAEEHRDAADLLLDFVKALQCSDSRDPNVNGAIAGSFPILGGYMTAGYPNWATKYFLDAVMMQHRLSSRDAEIRD